MKYLKTLLVVFLFASCEEYFQPDINVSEPAYVFDGLITDQPGPYKVRFMKTFGYNNETEPITDAIVRIECSDGHSYRLLYDSTGYYVSDSASLVGEIGKSYKLVAITSDKKHFVSTREKLLPCPEIEELSGIYYETKKIVKSGSNYFDEIDMGICATNTTNAAGFTPYYRYECKIVLQVRQHYPGSVPEERYVYRPLDLSDCLFVADANNYSNNKITENQLYKTLSKALNAGIDNLVPGMNEFELHNCGEFIRVKQYSLTESQFKYWKAVKDQQENSKYFFGKLESQPISNIECESGDKTLGYFCVSAVTQAFCALSLNEREKKIRKYNIKYFPDTDTVAYYKYPQPFTILFEN